MKKIFFILALLLVYSSSYSAYISAYAISYGWKGYNYVRDSKNYDYNDYIDWDFVFVAQYDMTSNAPLGTPGVSGRASFGVEYQDSINSTDGYCNGMWTSPFYFGGPSVKGSFNIGYPWQPYVLSLSVFVSASAKENTLYYCHSAGTLSW